MIDYSTLWQKGNELFYSFEQKEKRTDLSDEDRMMFVTGFIQGYLFLNNTEVCYEIGRAHV